MSETMIAIEQLTVNTIRTLSMDAVQKANSGHPGTPMALAPVAYQLWANHLNYAPNQPHWPARDRFVLSCGHASMLLYSLLHLAQVKKSDGADELSVRLDDIRNFRQWHSPCAGHPEFGEVTGAETTTGPLGQGVANSVGMAIAARWFAARYNRPGYDLFDYHTYVVCSDGDLMEGIGNEAASLAGHLQLGNLCWIYDDNKITIEGSTDLAYTENVAAKFESLGWRTVTVNDANNLQQLGAALANAKSGDDQPLMIIVRSVIGYGAPNKQNTAAAHGAPLGADEIRQAKQFYGWPADESFVVPPEALEHFRETLGNRGQQNHKNWTARFAEYKNAYPQLATELELIWSGQLPPGWEQAIQSFDASGKPTATRNWSGKVLNAVAAQVPWLIGGSADLAESNKSLIENNTAGHFSAKDPAGRNFHFGVREHAMAAICNGLSLSGLRSYAATFFVFTDYMRSSMRLSALMRRPVLYLLTHDSIGLGEDGPTHQPIEHLAACRAIPNLLVMRPADGAETKFAYIASLRNKQSPMALVLTRQNVPTYDRTVCGDAAGTLQGGYVLWQPQEKFDVILIGTGSEVQICWDAAQQLLAAGISARIVSLPCWELFDEQTLEYRESVLPSSCPLRIAVEAGIEMGWQKYLGPQGRFVGLSNFGASAPFETLYKKFGLTASRVVAHAQEMCGRKS